MKPELTKNQKLVLTTIQNCIRTQGRIPTHAQLAPLTGLSPLGVKRAINHLKARGYLTREDGELRTVGDANHQTMRVQVVSRLHRNQAQMFGSSLVDTVSLDSAMFDFDTVAAPPIFGLRVQGDAMKGAGICDGDYAFILPSRGKEGDLVAALLGDITLVRRYSVLPVAVRLDSANDTVRPIYLAPDVAERSLHICGVVCGVFRRVPEPKTTEAGDAVEFDRATDTGTPSSETATV